MKELIRMLRGRACFLRGKGEVKTPELLDQAADIILQKSNISQSENRYRVERNGFIHKVICGSGERKLYVGTKKSCLRVCHELATAYEDGKFMGEEGDA
ncbi:hypothetical protein KXR87_13040 [Yokenella regensburgei]|uniref:hypothetical protein n=1 Tax=Yokenella regensburgei TaxID=158877 RepID=UPI003F1745D4